MKFNLIEQKIVEKEDGMVVTRRTYEVGHYIVQQIVRANEQGDYTYYDVNQNENEDYSYLPNIYYHDTSEGQSEFRIGTASYGSQNTDTIKKIIDGYNQAVEVVTLLTDILLKGTIV